jgi:hypothetical protein
VNYAPTVAVDSDGEPLDSNYYRAPYINPDFPGREEGIQAVPFRVPPYRTFAFRAGSYTGYNRWRRELAALPEVLAELQEFEKRKPFYELVNFSDCEGTIGPVVSEILYHDFLTYIPTARECMDYYDFDLYIRWMFAFFLAKAAGMVRFV